MKRYNVAVVGATGLVGETMIKILEERKFPIERLFPIASENSRGKKIKFNGKDVEVLPLNQDSFKEVDFALFSAGNAISLEYAPIAAKAGAIVIDNSSAFRMEKDVPLVVPEVNGCVIASAVGARQSPGVNCIKGIATAALRPRDDRGIIIANPNCSTIQLVCVLKPIYDAVGIERVVVSTYQSVSGAGREAIEELNQQTAGSGQRSAKQVFPHQIAFNCIPRIDAVLPNGYTKEEMKVVNETKKILGDDSINITCTAVRVPVRVSHSESVNIETKKKLSAGEARKVLQKAKGVVVIDEPLKDKYPLAIEAEGRDEVFVGRIREDVSKENGLDLWIVSDNLRKGAATNAVQIAEFLLPLK